MTIDEIKKIMREDKDPFKIFLSKSVDEIIDAAACTLFHKPVESKEIKQAFLSTNKEYPDSIYLVGETGEGQYIARFDTTEELYFRTTSGMWMPIKTTAEQSEKLSLILNYLIQKVEYAIERSFGCSFGQYLAKEYSSTLHFGNNTYLCNEINMLAKSKLEELFPSMGLDAFTRRATKMPVTDAITFLQENGANMSNIHLTQN